jgi:hypothetical protein
MLKKAGIIVAVAAAGVLAVSPLAFATTDGEHGHGHGGHHNGGHHNGPGHSQVDVDYTSIESDNQSNDCPISQRGQDVETTAVGGSSLLGVLNPVLNVAAPVSVPISALNCTNVDVSDVIDFGSNNDTTTVERNSVEDSFNYDD